LSSGGVVATIEGIIRFVIFYKGIVKRFLEYFQRKYLKIEQFKESFILKKNFYLFERKSYKNSLQKIFT